MALLLAGERRVVSLGTMLLAVGAGLGLGAQGCSAPSHARRGPSLVQAARLEARAWDSQPADGHLKQAEESAALVARALHDTGLRFGTDGSTRALWGYLRTAHKVVPPAAARPGDIVFFDRHGPADRPPECADHTGIVTEVSASGRISFLEVRDGQVRTSYAHPRWPVVRRDDRDQVLNSFLRPKKIDDPPDGRYYAGEMLCGVARVSPGQR